MQDAVAQYAVAVADTGCCGWDVYRVISIEMLHTNISNSVGGNHGSRVATNSPEVLPR